MSLVALSNRGLSPKYLLQWGFAVRYVRGAATEAAAESDSNATPLSTSKTVVRKEKQSKSFGLDKKEQRLLRQKLLEANEEGSQKHHIFRHLYPWKTKLELAKDLKQSEVYNNGGLIALCKPYGIAQVKVEGKAKDGGQTVVQTLHSGGMPVNTPVLNDVLPILKEMYGVDDLQIVKTTERWTSGLLLLSTSQKMADKVAKCLRRSKAFEVPPLTFWVVANGIPNPDADTTKVAIRLEYIKDIGKIPIIVKKYKSIDVKTGKAKTAVVKHSTLMQNAATEASLLEVSVLTLRWHFLRVWLADKFSPVLGDSIYGGRIKSVAGKKIKLSPYNFTAYQPQCISSEIYKQLEIPEGTPEVIPSLIHMREMRLAQFNQDKSDLIIKAPPPEHFTWACEKLGISPPVVPELEQLDEDDAQL